MRSKPARQSWSAEIAAPGGVISIELDEKHVDRYNVDPDAFAAEYFGCSKAEYFEWLDRKGMPLCGGRTRAGEYCGIPVGGTLAAAEWRKRHRAILCLIHDHR